jgi:DNA (cytosine-5)-methyltransferase 1
MSGVRVMVKIGSLCSGYGGLDLAAEAHFNAHTVWFSEIDKHASQVFSNHFNVPNLGNLKEIDWEKVEPIDILTAGYPCQPFSQAGSRKGLNDERHIFPNILQGISILRPRIVILENVRGHLSLGFKEVLEGLTSIGYDAKWQVVRASEVGAPHQRARLFIVAYPISLGLPCGNSSRLESADPGIEDNGCATNANCVTCQESRRTFACVHGEASQIINRADRQKYRFSVEMDRQAIPNTLDKENKLNPKFVEYMMGLPEGWVTDQGLSRANQLKMLGNGVVPQQAKYALEILCGKSHNIVSQIVR